MMTIVDWPRLKSDISRATLTALLMFKYKHYVRVFLNCLHKIELNATTATGSFQGLVFYPQNMKLLAFSVFSSISCWKIDRVSQPASSWGSPPRFSSKKKSQLYSFLNTINTSYKKRLDLFGQRASVFAQLYLWLIPEFCKHLWKPLLTLIGVAGVFIAARASLAAYLVSSFRSVDRDFLSGDKTMSAGGYIELSIGQLVVLSWLGITLTAFIGFIYHRLVFWVARLFLDHSFKRLFSFVALPARFGSSLVLTDKEHNQFLRLGLTNARLTSVLIRIVLFSSFEMISTVICFLILLSINWQMTLMIIASVGPFVPIFYILTLDGIRKRRAMVPAFTLVARELAHFSNIVEADIGSTRSLKRFINKHSNSESVKYAFDLFQRQRLVIFKGEFAAGVLFATLICSCLYGFYLISDHAEFEFIPHFLGILIVMVYSLGRSLKSITSSNRFLDNAEFLRRVAIAKSPELDEQFSKSADTNPDLFQKLIYLRANKRDFVTLGPRDVLIYQRPQPKNPLNLLPLAKRLILPVEGTKSAYLKAVSYSNSLSGVAEANTGEFLQAFDTLKQEGLFPVVQVEGHDQVEEVLSLRSIQVHLSNFPLVITSKDRPVNASKLDFVKAVVWVNGWSIEEDWAFGDKAKIPAEKSKSAEEKKQVELGESIDEEDF